MLLATNSKRSTDRLFECIGSTRIRRAQKLNRSVASPAGAAAKRAREDHFTARWSQPMIPRRTAFSPCFLRSSSMRAQPRGDSVITMPGSSRRYRSRLLPIGAACGSHASGGAGHRFERRAHPRRMKAPVSDRPAALAMGCVERRLGRLCIVEGHGRRRGRTACALPLLQFPHSGLSSSPQVSGIRAPFQRRPRARPGFCAPMGSGTMCRLIARLCGDIDFAACPPVLRCVISY